jgi:hypothetical protein
MGRQLSRRQDAYNLAPPAPPCFQARLDWQEYAASAAESEHARGQFGPLVMIAGKAVSFNPQFKFCAECPANRQAAMLVADRCRPDWLLQMLAHAHA